MRAEDEPRVSITVPIAVRFDEIDLQQVVHHSNYLKYMEHVRLKLLEQQGLNFMQWVEKGLSAVVAQVEVNYRYPATYGDVLLVDCWIDQMRASSINFGYRVTEQQREKLIVEATVAVVVVNSKGRPTRIPEEVRTALSRPAA